MNVVGKVQKQSGNANINVQLLHHRYHLLQHHQLLPTKYSKKEIYEKTTL